MTSVSGRFVAFYYDVRAWKFFDVLLRRPYVDVLLRHPCADVSLLLL